MPPKAHRHSHASEDKATSFTWTNQAISIVINQLLEATRRGERVDNWGFKAVISTRIFDEFKTQGLPVPSIIALKAKKALISFTISLSRSYFRIN